MSQKSHQSCSYCGWSKVTSYQGLRIHQEKMGCTPKGLRIPESQQYLFTPSYSSYSSYSKPTVSYKPPPVSYKPPPVSYKPPPVKEETYSTFERSKSRPHSSANSRTSPPGPGVSTVTQAQEENSLQTCHCGWSKLTSYQGLRIHQGKMGCTPKGLGIPENLQSLFNSSKVNPVRAPVLPGILKEHDSFKDDFAEEFKKRTINDPIIKSQEERRTNMNPLILSTQHTEAKAKEEHLSVEMLSLTLQSDNNSTVAQQPVLMPVSQSSPVTPEAALKQENKTFFETPQHSRQSATDGNKTQRALDFSTGAQQAPMFLPIPTTPQETIVQPKEDNQETEMSREAEEKLLQLHRDKIRAEIQTRIRSREQKLAEVRSCVKACKGSLDAEWLEINSVFSDVIRVVEEARQKALQPLENRRELLKRDAHSLIKRLQEDIEKLERAMDEVDAADLDGAPLINLRSRDSCVNTAFSFGTLQTTISTLTEQIQQALDELSAVELKRIPAFAVDVKMDPTTAHQRLIVSKDRKKAQDGGQTQQLPIAPGRFDMFGSILGVNKFTSGRSYWEVEVGNKGGWDLGVAAGKANRKGKLTLSPDAGYWAIVHYEEDKYAALTAPPVCLELKEKPQKVGVFVDFDEGLVSFYDVTAQRHIHSFTKCLFNDVIFPYFSLHLKKNGKYSEPLVISPVKN